LTDHFSDEEFAPIAAAMKELPYFAPSPQFADKVMARVRIPGAARVPAVVESSPVVPLWESVAPAYAASERRAPVQRTDLRRSIPARIAAAAIVASATVTITAIALVSLFNLDLFLLVSRVFGPGTVSFLTALATETSTGAASAASAASASAGTAAGAAVIGSFAAGAVAATVALRAAATASRKAA
jgi:hypothetical protein